MPGTISNAFCLNKYKTKGRENNWPELLTICRYESLYHLQYDIVIVVM